MRSLFVGFAALLAAGSVQAQTADIRTVELAGKPFAAVPSTDGKLLYVTLTQGTKGLVVFDLTGTAVTNPRFAVMTGAPSGMALTKDGTLAVVAAQKQVVFVDTAKLVAGGQDAVLGTMVTGNGMSINATISPDDRYAFIAEEHDQAITVIDLAKAKAGGFNKSAIIGRIPTGNGPIAMLFSKDQRYLYATVEVGTRGPSECAAEVGQGTQAQGAIMIIDLQKVESNPGRSVVGQAPAGCSAVRLAASSDGSRLFVTARKDNAVRVFDAAKLMSDPKNAVIGKAAVGPSPVGVAVTPDGKTVFTANSDRFAMSEAHPYVSVVDVDTMKEKAVIPSGAFPRELRVTPDGSVLIITNFGSSSIELVDLKGLKTR